MKKNSEFINRLRKLLAALGSNAEVARASGVSDSRIPEWITGKRLPSPETLIRLGRVALERGMPDPFFFWALAGMDTRTLRLMTEQVLETRYSVGGKTVPIPRFCYVGGCMQEAGSPVVISAEFVPKPRTTICLCVDEKSQGIADSPRGIILLDTSLRGRQWREELSHKVVILDYSPRAPTSWSAGLYMGRILRDGPGIQADRVWIAVILETATEEGARRFGGWLPLGGHMESIAALGSMPSEKDEWERALRKFSDRVLSDLRLDEGIEILGKVIGRLTGHLEKPDDTAKR